jgi:glutamate racemase
MLSPRAATGPIGVFDSGIGGLSVLAALRQELPLEQFVYIGDAGYAPYGERDTTHVLKRSQSLADYLCTTHQAKALVLACNTATAAAVASLRARYPMLSIIGIEPALKPGAAQSSSGVVAVMATRSTLASDKFQALLSLQAPSVRFVLQACDGLAAAIEQADRQAIASLCQRYVQALRENPGGGAHIDTVVLGCTHYALITAILGPMWGPQVKLLEAGPPVARRTRQVLEAAGLLRPASVETEQNALSATTLYWSTGDPALLDHALDDFLGAGPNPRARALLLP